MPMSVSGHAIWRRGERRRAARSLRGGGAGQRTVGIGVFGSSTCAAPGQPAIARFARQNVIASVQPYHAIDDGRWAIQRVGAERPEWHLRLQVADRHRRACLFRFRLAGGAVRPLDRYCYGGATADHRWENPRRLDAGAAHHGRAGVVLAYTAQNAYGAIPEDRLGRLVPGYLADLVVLDKGPAADRSAATRFREGASYRGGWGRSALWRRVRQETAAVPGARALVACACVVLGCSKIDTAAAAAPIRQPWAVFRCRLRSIPIPVFISRCRAPTR